MPPSLFGPPPVVVGHRGAPVAHRENTPQSFDAAAEAGAGWVELDARLTADGGVVVHHDPALPDGRVLIDLDQAACRAAGVFSLHDVLRDLPPGLGVDLEVKNFPGEPDHDESMRIVERCAVILDELGLAGQDLPRPLLLSSFNPMVLVAAAGHGLAVPLGLVTFATAMAAVVETATELGCAAVCPHHSTEGLDAAGIAGAHDAGLAVMAWTVDDLARAADLVADGIDALCTNDPSALVGALGGRR